MTQFKDLFSKQSGDYSKFRPTYPESLFEYLASLTKDHELAWDCGTGNGQAALKLAPYFTHVVATDAAEKQIANAVHHEKIEYHICPAEKSPLKNQSVDLTTVAQAFHWFKHEEFYKEVRRVTQPGGVLAVWCYELAHITPTVDAVLHKLYKGILGSYWEGERRLVEEGYKNVSFPFEEIKSPPFEMAAFWSLDHLVGYLNTWSALQTFLKKNGRNPIEDIFEELKTAWGSEESHLLKWPLGLRVVRI